MAKMDHSRAFEAGQPASGGAGGPSRAGAPAWGRARRVLRCDKGAFAEIAAARNGVSQGFVVAIVAGVVGDLWSGPVMLLSIPLRLITAIVVAACCRLLSGFAVREAQPKALLGVMLYTAAPAALGIVPIVGWFAGIGYTIVLRVAAIREVAGVTTGAAIAIVLLASAVAAALFAGLWAVLGLAVFLASLSEFATVWLAAALRLIAELFS